MSTLDFNPLQRTGRERRRPGMPVAHVELLEERQLMAYSPLGYSLPELVVSGSAAGVAAYGGQIGVNINVQNLGASSIIEPFALTPGATSTADAPATTVNVYMTSSSRFTPRSAVLVGSVAVPAIPQNDRVEISSALTLPARPRGFPGPGGAVYLTYVVNPSGAILQNDARGNVSAPMKVTVTQPALPNLQLVDLDLPANLSPGDTIAPVIQVGNFGTAATSAQGPVKVLLVASVNRTFNSGSTILGTYTVANIDAASSVVGSGSVLGDPRGNIATIEGAQITLPTSPRTYYLGVVIDPDNTIQELNEGGRRRGLLGVRTIGRNRAGLPSANVTGGAGTTLFPVPSSPISTALAGSKANQIAAGTVIPTTNADWASMSDLNYSAGTTQGGRLVVVGSTPRPTRLSS